ncbi:MAG: hypothetical protein ACOX68_00095 [Candidatus Limivicinus sp.]|jgi:hypothetical protein
MKENTKTIFRVIIFILIFTICFLYVQEILRVKLELSDNLFFAYDDALEDQADGLETDVIFLGSSPMYAGITPIVMWDEAGITALNIAATNGTAMGHYYLLCDVLERVDTKMVVLDFQDLCDERYLSGKWIPGYDRRFYTIKSLPVRWRFLKDMLSTSDEMSLTDYLFPIGEGHGRWPFIEEMDFTHESSEYRDYFRGALMYTEQEKLDGFPEYKPDTSPDQIKEFSADYYRNIIKMCSEKGIKVLGVQVPLGLDKTSEVLARKEFCRQQGIEYIDLNEPEFAEKIGSDCKTDFYNRGHQNLLGSVKTSRFLAQYLTAEYDIPDHRADPLYDRWNEMYRDFTEDYDTVLAELEKGAA